MAKRPRPAKIGYIYIDSGAMYRAVTLYSMENGIFQGDRIDTEKLKKSNKGYTYLFPPEPRNRTPGHLPERNKYKKTKSVTNGSVFTCQSHCSIGFRTRSYGGTATRDGQGQRHRYGRARHRHYRFPGCRAEIFVTASPEIRAQRRYDELKAKGEEASFDEILENVKQRDYIDQNREVSPLRKASDALLLDNSHLSISQQKEWLAEQFERVIKEKN